MRGDFGSFLPKTLEPLNGSSITGIPLWLSRLDGLLKPTAGIAEKKSLLASCLLMLRRETRFSVSAGRARITLLTLLRLCKRVANWFLKTTANGTDGIHKNCFNPLSRNLASRSCGPRTTTLIPLATTTVQIPFWGLPSHYNGYPGLVVETASSLERIFSCCWLKTPGRRW